MESLDHRVALCLISRGISVLFSMVAAQVCIPTNCARGCRENTFLLFQGAQCCTSLWQGRQQIQLDLEVRDYLQGLVSFCPSTLPFFIVVLSSASVHMARRQWLVTAVLRTLSGSHAKENIVPLFSYFSKCLIIFKWL